MIPKIPQDLESWIIDIRRDFHMHPELGFEEFRTSEKIKAYLADLNIPYKSSAKTGIIGEIKGKDSSITIALRADIDALPIEELNDCAYKSQIKGKMHACGHDAHTAILLGVAKACVATLPPCNIRLIFQPAEETDGGAVPMIEEGVLTNVNGILGLHVDSAINTGTIGIKYGYMNAASDMITIKLFGTKGHGAYPKGTVDCIVIAAAVINNLQSIVSRNIDARESVVLTLGSISGGTARNIICDEVTIEGTIRTLNAELRELVNQRAEEIISLTAQAFGGRSSYIRNKGYTALLNDDNIVDLIKKNGENLLGLSNIHIKQQPNMGVEDFAYYLEKVPGAFFYLGVRNENKNITAPAHNEYFDIDESALIIGVKMQLANISSLYTYLKHLD
ncbi:MAG: M20 metallopeptidase family protein [Brevinemataceae bacterium]